MEFVKRLFQLLATFISVATLMACSSGTETQPTAVPSVPTSAPTISPGGRSVGSVLDDINRAWDFVHSLRTTFWTASDEVTVDSLPTDGEVTIEIAIAPNQRHVTRMVDGLVVEEQISSEGRIAIAS